MVFFGKTSISSEISLKKMDFWAPSQQAEIQKIIETH